MSNLHHPQRLQGESFEAYRERRAASKSNAQAIRLHGIGDQHKAPSAREQLRSQQRRNGNLRSGGYGRGLMNQWERQREREQKAKGHLRDEHGALTLTGSEVTWVNVTPGPREFELGGSTGPDGFTKRTRRIWLAGISAQRGY